MNIIESEYYDLQEYRSNIMNCLRCKKSSRPGLCNSCEAHSSDFKVKFSSNFDGDYVIRINKIRYAPSDAELIMLLMEYPKLAELYIEKRDNK